MGSSWKTYRVTLTKTEYYEIDVKARNKSEARFKAEDKADDAEYVSCGGVDVVMIEAID